MAKLRANLQRCSVCHGRGWIDWGYSPAGMRYDPTTCRLCEGTEVIAEFDRGEPTERELSDE